MGDYDINNLSNHFIFASDSKMGNSDLFPNSKSKLPANKVVNADYVDLSSIKPPEIPKVRGELTLVLSKTGVDVRNKKVGTVSDAQLLEGLEGNRQLQEEAPRGPVRGDHHVLLREGRGRRRVRPGSSCSDRSKYLFGVPPTEEEEEDEEDEPEEGSQEAHNNFAVRLSNEFTEKEIHILGRLKTTFL